jgi:hypothetical protein
LTNHGAAGLEVGLAHQHQSPAARDAILSDRRKRRIFSRKGGFVPSKTLDPKNLDGGTAGRGGEAIVSARQANSGQRDAACGPDSSPES